MSRDWTRDSTVLAAGPRYGLEHFRELLDELGYHADRLVTDSLALVGIRSPRMATSATRPVPTLEALERRWYDSLADGGPDYSVYDAEEYLADAWACWIAYSRRYLIDSRNPGKLPPDGILHETRPASVVDLGCGLGYSTAALAQLLPDAQVVGTNVPGSAQWTINMSLGERYGFTVATEPPESVDLVFASEYFEHFPEPLEELETILALEPKALLVANTFGPRSIGHFDVYTVHGDLMDPAGTSRAFDERLVRDGYERVRTKCWNRRPTYWRRRADYR